MANIPQILYTTLYIYYIPTLHTINTFLITEQGKTREDKREGNVKLSKGREKLFVIKSVF